MHERKTFTIEYPNVPIDYVRDFVRGVFDGDGCIHIGKKKNRVNSYVKEFSILGTFNLLSGIANNLPCKSHIRKYRKIYVLSISREDDLFEIYNFLYSNKNSLKLNRKEIHFKYVLETLKNAKIEQNLYVKKEQSPRIDNEHYIKMVKKIHGNKYEYSLVNFINNKTDIDIICKEHGIFKQKPYKHLMGHNCPKCSGSFMDKIILLKNQTNFININIHMIKSSM